MKISNRTLVQIAAWGGLIVSSTGFYLQTRLVDRIRSQEFYKDAMRKLRVHAGAVKYLGEPIKDRRFKLSDSKNNNCNEQSAQYCIPVSGSRERGRYYIWAARKEEKWAITRAELELKSKPDQRLVIVKD